MPSGAGEPIPARAVLSDEIISPTSPPDAKDGFRLLVEGATEYAVYALSPAGVICTWNRGAERMKGYRPDEVIGRHFSMFFPEPDRQAGVPSMLLASALADGRVLTDGWRIRKDGTRFWASVIVSTLYDDLGRVRGFGKLVRDDTDHRRSQDRAIRHAEQERIAVTLADTVVRSLFSMSLHADAAIRMLDGSEPARQQLEMLVRETDETIRFLRNTVFDIGSAEGDTASQA